MSRLLLLRHAEPSEDAHGRCYGTLDVGLSDAGRAAARALAQLPYEYDAVYTSPRMRAYETAVAITVHEPIVDRDLRELDFGELEGRTYDEIAESDPELFRAWMESPTSVRFPGGESFADLQRRALAAFERIRARHESALVVTHGGVVRAGLAAWLGMPDEAIFRLDVRYCGLTVVEWFGDFPLVRLLNG